MRRFASKALRAAFGAGIFAISCAVSAQAWPTKMVEVTVPYPPGGGVDLLGRLIGTELSKLGQGIVVENRAGAGGTIGTAFVATRPKDGYSLLMTNDAYSLAPSVYKTLSYNPKRDLTAVIGVAYAPMLVLVPASSKQKTLSDLMADSAKTPLSWGSCGAGTDPQLAGEMLNIAFKTKNVHIPYKGCGPAIVDVLGSQLPYAVVTISGALPYVQSGKLKALAITSKERSKTTPNVPTVAESGAPDFNLSQWQGFFAPAGTSDAVKLEIYKKISAIIKTEAMQHKLIELGYTPADENPAAFQKIVNDDMDRFAALAKKIGLTPE